MDVLRFDFSVPGDDVAVAELVKQLRYYPHDLIAIVDVRSERLTITVEPAVSNLIKPAWRKQTRERRLRTNRILRVL